MNHSKLKVTFLITAIQYGGSWTQLKLLATRFKSRGWDVHVISIMPFTAPVDELEDNGITVVSLETTRKDPIALSRAYIKALKLLRAWGPDILHSHMVHANLLGRTARLLCHIPVLISTAHNMYPGGKLREVAYRLSDPLADMTTIISQAAAERYVRIKSVPRHKLRVIPNGIDTKRFYPNPETRNSLRRGMGLDDYFVWLAAGRIKEEKDYPNMLRAFAQIARQDPKTVLVIAGQGHLRPELEALSEKLSLGGRAHFLGVRKDMPELMNAADAYLMSSAWEGMPMVLLEAAATELPIVATNVGGNGEIVQNSESGFLVPPHDPEALAEAMQRMMSLSEAERKRMGKAGRSYVEHYYSLDHIIDTWENLYMELLNKKGS